MTKITLLTLLIVFFMTNLAAAQAPVKLVKAQELLSSIDESSAGVRVINIMASWCRPCVAELPIFKNMEQHYANNAGVEFLYISLDFAEDTATRLMPLMKKNGITGRLWLLDEPGNDWIDRVEKSWDGAIPITIIAGRGKRIFHQGTVDERDITDKIDKLLAKE